MRSYDLFEFSSWVFVDELVVLIFLWLDLPDNQVIGLKTDKLRVKIGKNIEYV